MPIILTDADPAPAPNTLVFPAWIKEEAWRRLVESERLCAEVFGYVVDADGQPYYGPSRVGAGKTIDVRMPARYR